jgi:folate-dependent phosphoribosylglycinamide formyltransferase PurN
MRCRLSLAIWFVEPPGVSHGVTIHKMEPGIDTGPIVYQELFDIDDAESVRPRVATDRLKSVPLY